MKYPPRSLFPRRLIPSRSREVRCYPDCPRQEDEDATCTCYERDEMAYDAECEARYDRWKNGDYDD